MHETSKKVAVDAVRIEHRTDLSFYEVVRRFESGLGSLDTQSLEVLLNAGSEEWREKVRSLEGSSGLMRFLTVDHGRAIEQTGRDAECRRYTIGNPLLGATLLQYDLGAALFMPMQAVIYRDTVAQQTVLSYLLPSSLAQAFGNEGLTHAAKAADERLLALSTLAIGVGP